MASGAVYKELTELVSCPICFTQFKDVTPRMLPCLHVLCETCIDKIMNARRTRRGEPYTITCPLCNRLIKVPQRCAAKLPHYYPFTRVEDCRRFIEERHTYCQVYEKHVPRTETSYFCLQCFAGMCEACSVEHDRFYPKHTKVHATASTVKSLICPEHDQCVNYFCITCNRAVCSTCRVKEHNRHTVHNLSYDGGEDSDGLKAFLMVELQHIEKVLGRLDVLQEEVKRDTDRIQHEIDQHHSDILIELSQQHRMLHKMLADKQDGVNKEIENSKRSLEKARISLKKFIEQVESWSRPVKGIPEARIEQLDEVMSDIRDEIQCTEFEMDKSPRMEFVPDAGNINLGQIVEEDVLHMNLQAEPTLTCHIKQTEEVNDIAFLGSKLIALSKYSLAVYNGSGQRIHHHLSDVCKVKPGKGILHGICVNNLHSTVAVIENRGPGKSGCLNSYVLDDTMWLHHKYSICENPVHVACTKCGHFIFSSKDGKMYKYSKEGMEIWCRHLSDKPDAISVDNVDKILVCFSDSVCVYNQDGYKTASLKTRGRDVLYKGMCVFRNGDILMSDWKSQSILLLRNNGDFVRQLIDVEAQPIQIALCQNKYLAVREWTHGTIKVYKL